MRYWPDSSETPVRALVMSAGLDASIVTPGSTAPEVSFTVPARLWAVARLAPAPRIATTASNRINTRFMSEPPQPPGHEDCPAPEAPRRLRDYGPFDRDCQENVMESASASRWWRRQRSAFGERLHVLHPAHERRAPPILVRLLRRIVRQIRVIEKQRVHELRCRRRHGTRFERAVVHVVALSFTDRLGVGVRELGLADEDFAPHRPHGAELAVFARRDRAGVRHLEPLADIAVFSDALPHFRGRTVDVDFHFHRRVRGIRGLKRRRRRRLRPGDSGQVRAHNDGSQEMSDHADIINALCSAVYLDG